MMTLSLTVILGMLGLAVDLGWAYYRQQAAQSIGKRIVSRRIQESIAPFRRFEQSIDDFLGGFNAAFGQKR